MLATPQARAAQPRVSVLYPLMAYDLDDLARFARAVQDFGLDRLYLGQSTLVESHQAVAYLAGKGLRVPVGLSVALTPLRHPMDAAVQARSLAVLTGSEVVAGYGIGDPDFVASLRGERYASPRTAIAEYLSIMRGLLDGDAVEFRGEYFSMDDGLHQIPNPGVSLGAGLLRPKMAHTVGQSADVAITLLTPPAYLSKTLRPALREGAESVGRAVPRVATIVSAALERPSRDPRKLAYAAHESHLSGPHYAAMLRAAGLRVDPGDPWAGAKSLVEGGVFAYGTPESLSAQVAEYQLHGEDEIVLNVLGVLLTEGVDAALADLATMVHAIRGDSSIDSGVTQTLHRVH